VSPQKFIAVDGGVWLYPRSQNLRRAEFPPVKGPPVAHYGWADMVNRKRMQIFYSGRVQGVGFRYTAKTVAMGYDLSGMVRNLPDGRVELVAEGAKDELEAFREAIRESGLGHFIQKEEASWGEAQSEFRGFEIVR
jgi:acylphosphatase